MAGKETLLVVEDNHVLREGLRDILACEGYTVLAAANGREALGQMQVISPDLIISDIAMPEMDGYAFFAAVRNQPEWLAIPFVFLTARGEKEDVLTGKDMGAEDYLIKPLTREELLTAVRARLERSQQLRMAQLQQAYESSLTVLANAIDVRDPYTRGHVERVTAYSLAIAEELGWKGHSLDRLRFGAILHDIGKIIIPESILFKPEPLNEAEWDEIRQHPLTGAEMIKDIPFLSPAMPVVRHHHERWDGAGYPDHLSGKDIPIAARIVAVADSFDAMTTDRPYQKHHTPHEAYDEITASAGTQYDPRVVTAFQSLWLAGKVDEIRRAWEAGLL